MTDARYLGRFTQPIYEHPDGMGSISYNPKTQTLSIENESESTATTVLVGQWGLREIARSLLNIASEMDK